MAQSASAIKDAALKTALASGPTKGKEVVLITTASPGSGKTASLSGEAASKVGLKVEQIFDEVPKGKLILQQMIDAGFRPEISWIHVDQIGKTVERMVFRAKKIGRTVPLSYMAESYLELPKTLRALMDHFGDKISVRVIENSGEKGTATVHKDPTAFLDKHTGEEYNQLRAQALERLEGLKNDGHLDDDRGQAIYKAAKAGTTPIATPHGHGNIDGSSNRSEESVERKSSGSELRSSLLEKPAAPKPVEKLSPSPSETDSTYREQVKAAKGRSQRENVARSSPQVVDAGPRKAVVLDADSLGAWHRTFGEEGKFAGADDMGHTSVHIVGANF